MPMKFCLDCSKLTRNGSRCEACAGTAERARDRQRGSTKQRGLGGTHRRAAEKIVKTAAVCAICGKPPTADDPLTADHTVPRAHGGVDSPLRAVHRTCNSRRGARTGNSPVIC